MSNPSFRDLAGLLKKPTTTTHTLTRPEAPDAVKWLENFGIWLEEAYQKTVHHERLPGLHASSLYETCGRKEMLLALLKPGPEKLRAGQLATFDVGHMMHWWWQHRYLGPKQELWGQWYCAGCNLTTTGFMPLNCSCGRDWRSAMNYKELSVEDKELGYTGHTDGILVDRMSGVRRVFEFKSISPSEYKDLSKPKYAHIIQAHAYMRRLGTVETLIVYQNKGSQCEWKMSETGELTPGKLNIKAFIVKFDPALWTKVEGMIHDRATALAELNLLLKDGTPVSEGHVCSQKRICETKRDDAAKYCPVRNQCFNLAAPGEVAKPKDIWDEFRMPI